MSWRNLKAPNMGMLVYKKIYTEQAIKTLIKLDNDKNEIKIDVPKNEENNPFKPFYKDLCNMPLSDYRQIENPAANNRFCLKTSYPGLLCGAGYTHDSNTTGDLRFGFHFDHTSGQPVIPGSSIKGILKSVFEDETDLTTDDVVESFKRLLDECKLNDWKSKNITKESLSALKNEIFGQGDNEGKDRFFDAVLRIDKHTPNTKFIATDYITPHTEGPLKNPIPLLFLKVRPSIVFEFRFQLVDTEIDNHIITKADKEHLFLEILKLLGVGAKTNVGYGQLEEVECQKNN